MEHHFRVEDAKLYGIESAILLYNIRFWIDKNKANGKHFYNGKFWTYNSARAFSELFPYLSRPQIARHLRKLEDLGVLESGTFNNVGYDKTKWYSIIVQPCTDLYNDGSELNNGMHENEQPIPDNKTDINTDNKHPLQIEFEKSVEEFVKMRKIIKKPLTEKGIELVKNKVRKLSKGQITVAIEILNQSIENSWQGVFALKEESQQDNPNRGGSPNKKAL